MEQAAFASYLPTGDSGCTPFDVVGTGREGPGNLFSVSPGACDVLGIPNLNAGATSDTSDLASSRGVAIISSKAGGKRLRRDARTAWPPYSGWSGECSSHEEVIGVVGDVRSSAHDRTTPTRAHSGGWVNPLL